MKPSPEVMMLDCRSSLASEGMRSIRNRRHEHPELLGCTDKGWRKVNYTNTGPSKIPFPPFSLSPLLLISPVRKFSPYHNQSFTFPTILPTYCNHLPVAGRHTKPVKMQFAVLLTFVAAAMAASIPKDSGRSCIFDDIFTMDQAG